MFDRRSLILGSGAAILAGNAPARLLDRAIAQAGGRRALQRVRSIGWEGAATIFAGDRRIDIGVRTSLIPFRSARSDSWLASDGPAKTNSMIIEEKAAWIERAGRAREAMPASMAAHERAQFAIYGLMLLAPLYDEGCLVTPGPALNTLFVRHPAAPSTILGFDGDARLTWATNRVPSFVGDTFIDQRFSFEGVIWDGPINWPKRLRIAQSGQPYFDLQLDKFVSDRS